MFRRPMLQQLRLRLLLGEIVEIWSIFAVGAAVLQLFSP
jgi:hypothetical protein